MIKLGFLADRKIKDHVRGHIITGGKEYYFRRGNPNDKDIIIERLASLVGIRCKHYDMAITDERRYYLEEEVPDSDYRLFANLGITSGTLQGIIKELNRMFPHQADVLTIELIQIYLFDILTLNPYRSDKNIGVYYNNPDNLDLMICNNSNPFSDLSRCGISSYPFENSYDVLNPDVLGVRMTNNSTHLIDLENFLSEAYPEYIDLLREMVTTLSPDVVDYVINGLENEIGTKVIPKDIYLKRYSENYEKITELLRKYSR